MLAEEKEYLFLTMFCKSIRYLRGVYYFSVFSGYLKLS